MKKIFILTAFSVVVSVIASACGGSSNNATNVNANRVNANSSTVGNATNSLSNAANSVANAVSSATTPAPDAFMRTAAEGGLAEVELGKIAAKNGKDAEVKKFGQTMVADHTKLNAELKTLAAKKNITLPTDVGSYRSTIDDFSKITGAEFDTEYVDAMVDDHEDDLAAFQKQADNSEDADLKAFAAKAVTVIKKHLETIKALQTKMNNAAAK